MLLVEDDLISAAAMNTILRRRGFEVFHVTTVAKGLEQLAVQPAFVLLDLMLPDGNGTIILKYIREKKLPMRVIVTTAVHDGATLQAVQDLKPEVTMQKPIDILKLLSLMEPLH